MAFRIPFDQLLSDAGFVIGWHGNGEPLGSVRAIVIHDTVTDLDESRGYDERLESYAWRLAHDFDSPPPPVYHVLYGDDGQRWVLANGRANHNGYGEHGNDTIGLASETRGGMANPEPANEDQLSAIAEDCRRIRAHFGDVPVLGHRETDPDRKIDPHGVDLDELRRRVAGELTDDDDQEGDVPLQHGDGIGDREHLAADVEKAQKWCNIIRTGSSGEGMTVDGKFLDETEKHVRDVEARFYGRKSTTGKVDDRLWAWLANTATEVVRHGYTFARR